MRLDTTNVFQGVGGYPYDEREFQEQIRSAGRSIRQREREQFESLWLSGYGKCTSGRKI